MGRLDAGRAVVEAGDDLGRRCGRGGPSLPTTEALGRGGGGTEGGAGEAAGMGGESSQHVVGDGGRGAVARGGESVAQGAHNQAAHQRRIAEPHLGLCGVDVHIDVERIDVEKQHRRRMPVAGEEVGIGAAQRPLQQPVLHGAAVDEQILMARVAARVGRQPRVASQADVVPRLINQQGVGLEVAAEEGGEPLQTALVAGVFGGQAQGGPAV